MDRIVVVETVQCVSPGPPVSRVHRFWRKLKSGEVPFIAPQRKSTVDWAPLPLGWVAECSMLHVVNTGKGVLHLSCGVEVPPGESARFKPSDLTSLSVRGETSYTLTLFPE